MEDGVNGSKVRADEDPLLALAGSRVELWSPEHADEYAAHELGRTLIVCSAEPRDRLVTNYSCHLLNTRQPFVPPKPKELDMA